LLSQLRKLSNGRASRQAEFGIKRGHLPGPDHSFLDSSIRSFNSTLATSRDTHQEGRNNAGLPGHDALWTGHYTAEQNSLSSSTQLHLRQLPRHAVYLQLPPAPLGKAQ